VDDVISDQLALGRALMRLRERSGLSQAELAVCLGLETAYVPAVEAGEMDLRWHTLMRFLRGLDATVSDLAAELD
jgi:transcriptional regulator with XRE-family HTH domain